MRIPNFNSGNIKELPSKTYLIIMVNMPDGSIQ